MICRSRRKWVAAALGWFGSVLCVATAGAAEFLLKRIVLLGEAGFDVTTVGAGRVFSSDRGSSMRVQLIVAGLRQGSDSGFGIHA